MGLRDLRWGVDRHWLWFLQHQGQTGRIGAKENCCFGGR